MKVYLAALAILLTSCGSETEYTNTGSTEQASAPENTCESIRSQVVDATSDDGVKILKIYSPELVSQTDELLSCKGSAAISTGDDRQVVYYKLETDEDGDTFVGYSPNPYPAKKL